MLLAIMLGLGGLQIGGNDRLRRENVFLLTEIYQVTLDCRRRDGCGCRGGVVGRRYWILFSLLLPLENGRNRQNLVYLLLWCTPITAIPRQYSTSKDKGETCILAFKIQSKSSSPSSEPPGPPLTALNNRGRQSTPSSTRFAASSLCISSILVFSSVANSWSRALTA